MLASTKPRCPDLRRGNNQWTSPARLCLFPLTPFPNRLPLRLPLQLRIPWRPSTPIPVREWTRRDRPADLRPRPPLRVDEAVAAGRSAAACTAGRALLVGRVQHSPALWRLSNEHPLLREPAVGVAAELGDHDDLVRMRLSICEERLQPVE